MSESQKPMFNGWYVVIVLVAVSVAIVFTSRKGSGPGTGDGNAHSVPDVTTNAVRRSLTRKPLEPEATKRLAEGPQVVTTVFQATGLGSWTKSGLEYSGKYFLTAYVKAESTACPDREKTARGNIEVTEIRKFTEVRDQLTVSEADVKLAIRETLPVETVSQIVDGIGAVLGFFSLPAGRAVVTAGEGMREAIKAVDGTSMRGLCGQFGVKIPADIEAWAQQLANEYVDGKLADIRTKVHSIEGKSFKIVYLQDKEGVPLRVDFTNVDGSPIPEDEWDILKLANVFIDAQVIPDKRTRPGDRWEVDAETIAGLVDPVAQGGECEGKLSVERQDDLPNGDWKLRFLPARIVTKSSRGATAGVFRIKDGNAVGDGENAYVKTMELVGTGRLEKSTSKRWAIFDFMERIGGECEFRAVMTSIRAE